MFGRLGLRKRSWTGSPRFGLKVSVKTEMVSGDGSFHVGHAVCDHNVMRCRPRYSASEIERKCRTDTACAVATAGPNLPWQASRVLLSSISGCSYFHCSRDSLLKFCSIMRFSQFHNWYTNTDYRVYRHVQYLAVSGHRCCLVNALSLTL